MNVMNAMEDTMLVAKAHIHRHAQQTVPATVLMEYEHLIHMRDKMRSTPMSYGKMNRWLGWMQATVVSWGHSTLEDMKDINSRHAGDEPRMVVVCLNDFPDGVFDSQDLADAYIAEQKALFEKVYPSRKRYWHTHAFTRNKGAHS